MPVTEALRTSLLHEMFVASRKLRTVFDARARERGMTYARARLLLHLVQSPGSTQAELADALEVERPTMARLIDGMEKAGLVTREPCDDDRRVRRVALTDAAEGQVEDVLRLTETLRADALAGIDPDDVATARRVIGRVIANLAAAG
jgi:MarR family transcriptional regulator, transcriptional regulator for hemolysin